MFDYLDKVLVNIPGCTITAFALSNAINIKQAGRQGEKFDGNHVKRLMDNILSDAKVVEECLPVTTALKSFKVVVDKCFGMELRGLGGGHPTVLIGLQKIGKGPTSQSSHFGGTCSPVLEKAAGEVSWKSSWFFQ